MNKIRAAFRWLSEDEYGQCFLVGLLCGASAAAGYWLGGRDCSRRG